MLIPSKYSNSYSRFCHFLLNYQPLPILTFFFFFWYYSLFQPITCLYLQLPFSLILLLHSYRKLPIFIRLTAFSVFVLGCWNVLREKTQMVDFPPVCHLTVTVIPLSTLSLMLLVETFSLSQAVLSPISHTTYFRIVPFLGPSPTTFLFTLSITS